MAAAGADELRRAYGDWMATPDPEPVRVLHLDGKGVRNADPAPARVAQEPALAEAAAALDTPQQKPKAEHALTRVNSQPPNQRLIGQIAVPRDTNEEAGVAAQVFRIDQTVEYLRRGQVYKTTG